ncbi:MAG: hypothetical protein QMC79_05205 [Anaerosomatales bacterium]|nr:hypothetical protein [Anaerosomatales bacterium]
MAPHLTSPSDVRIAYLTWVRQAALATLVLPVLIAAEQVAAARGWWGAPDAGAGTYIVWALAAGCVFLARGERMRLQRSERNDEEDDVLGHVRSVSWRLVLLPLGPALLGFGWSFASKQVADFAVMFVVSLVVLAVYFPRYEQWLAWTGASDASGGGAG